MSISQSSHSPIDSEFASNSLQHLGALPTLHSEQELANSDLDDHSVDNDPTLLRLAAAGIQSTISAAMDGYLSTWLFYAVFAFGIGLVSNGLFHIQLWQVVDVILSLFFTFVGLQIAASILNFVMADEEDLNLNHALYRLVICLLWFMLPFSIVAGFLAYGAIAQEAVIGKSVLYQSYQSLFVDGYRSLESQFGDFLGLIKTTKDATGKSLQSIDIDLVIKYLTATSILIAIGRSILGRKASED